MTIIEEIQYKFRTGNAVVKIILVNAAVFLFVSLLTLVGFLFKVNDLNSWVKWLMLPASFGKLLFQPWSLFTYMFLHQGFLHILFNMIWFYFLGTLFQQYLGNGKTYQAYFLGGIFGGLVFMIAYNVFPVFASGTGFAYAVGASAGVLSVVVATATLLPEYPVQLFLLGSIRLKYIALFSVLIDLLSIPQQNPGGHIAHLGGAAFGFLYIKFIYTNNSFTALIEKVSGLFAKRSPLKVHYSKGMKYSDPLEKSGAPTQKEIDAILDKISKSGYESLSKKEKEILFKASK